MRITLDTNVLISMVLFPSRRFTTLLDGISREHTLILSSFVVDELNAVVARKFPSRTASIDKFLSNLNFELIHTPHTLKIDLFEIRDVNDYPVLYSAIIGDVDILITGDKDFLDVKLKKPEILTPAQFVDKYL